jgi:hypothetical protein
MAAFPRGLVLTRACLFLQAEEAWESGDGEVRLWGVFNETRAQVEGLQHRQTALVEAAERAARAHIKVREGGVTLLWVCVCADCVCVWLV